MHPQNCASKGASPPEAPFPLVVPAGMWQLPTTLNSSPTATPRKISTHLSAPGGRRLLPSLVLPSREGGIGSNPNQEQNDEGPVGVLCNSLKHYCEATKRLNAWTNANLWACGSSAERACSAMSAAGTPIASICRPFGVSRTAYIRVSRLVRRRCKHPLVTSLPTRSEVLERSIPVAAMISI